MDPPDLQMTYRSYRHVYGIYTFQPDSRLFRWEQRYNQGAGRRNDGQVYLFRVAYRSWVAWAGEICS